MNDNTLSKLRRKLGKQKFSKETWAKRNVNPSEASINSRMDYTINKCIEEIIQNKNNPIEQLGSIINKHTSLINGFDTEEREFLHDEFWKIAKLLEVLPFVEIFKENYQFHLENKDFNPNIHEEEVIQECSSCKIILKLIVLEKEVIPKIENGNLSFENNKESINNVSCNKCKSVEKMRIPAFSTRLMYKNCLPV